MQEYVSNLMDRLKCNEELVERYRRESFENEQKLKISLKLCTKAEYDNESLT